MKIDCGIKYLDYYLPNKTVLVDDVLKAVDLSSEQILQFKLEGMFREICVFDKEYDFLSHLINMVAVMFEKTEIEKKKIKYLICGNDFLINRDTSAMHYIQKHFNLDDSIILPIFQPCTSTLFSIGLGAKFLGENEYSLIFSGNNYNSDIGKRHLFTVFGDGLGLALVGKDKSISLRVTDWFSFNDGSSSYNKTNSALKNDSFSLAQRIARSGTSLIKKSLLTEKMNIACFDKIITSNLYYDLWSKIYPLYLECSSSSFYLDNYDFGGHINDMDVVRNLKDYLSKTNDDKEKRIMLFGVDLGVSYDFNYQLLFLKY